MPRWSLAKTLLILSAFQLSVSAKCKSNTFPYSYHFMQQVDIGPYQKIYHVGDTLSLSFTDTAGMIFDTVTQSLINADSFQYTIRAGIERLDNFKKPVPRDGYFLTSKDGIRFSRNLEAVNYGVTNVDTRIECGTGQDRHYIVQLIPRQPGIYSADLFLFNGVQYCYDKPAAGAQLAFFFRLQDCNADLLSGMDSSSVNIPSYTNLALTKRAFIFKVE